MDNSRFTPEAKLVCRWALTGFLLFVAVIFMPSVTSLCALMAAVLIVPLKKWQIILKKYTGKFIKGKAKSAVIAVLMIIAVITVPVDDYDVKAVDITPSKVSESTSETTVWEEISKDSNEARDITEAITEEATERNNNSSDIMVWIPTKGGKKYHSNQWCSSMDEPEYVTLDEAERRGFTPCKRCY